LGDGPDDLPHPRIRRHVDVPALSRLRSPPVREFRQQKRLWGGALLTAAAALFFPKIEAIRYHDEPIWRLVLFFVPSDIEGLILIPLIILIIVALFAFLGGWAWRDAGGRNRPARVGLLCGFLGLVGVVAFFLSSPIILGGLAITLGLEGRRRAGIEGRGTQALAAIVVGSLAVAVGAAIWTFGLF